MGGSPEEHLRIYKDFLEEKISYTESKEPLLRVWQVTGRVNKQTFKEIFEKLPLREETQEVINFLKDKGLITCIITGSMDLCAEVFARRLGIPFYYANTTLIWGKEGNLVDYHYFKDQADKKLEQFQQFCQEQDLKFEECIIVGDDENDIELFRIARGIALRSPDSQNIEPIAWKVINNLLEIKEVQFE